MRKVKFNRIMKVKIFVFLIVVLIGSFPLIKAARATELSLMATVTDVSGQSFSIFDLSYDGESWIPIVQDSTTVKVGFGQVKGFTFESIEGKDQLNVVLYLKSDETAEGKFEAKKSFSGIANIDGVGYQWSLDAQKVMQINMSKEEVPKKITEEPAIDAIVTFDEERSLEFKAVTFEPIKANLGEAEIQIPPSVIEQLAIVKEDEKMKLKLQSGREFSVDKPSEEIFGVVKIAEQACQAVVPLGEVVSIKFASGTYQAEKEVIESTPEVWKITLASGEEILAHDVQFPLTKADLGKRIFSVKVENATAGIPLSAIETINFTLQPILTHIGIILRNGEKISLPLAFERSEKLLCNLMFGDAARRFSIPLAELITATAMREPARVLLTETEKVDSPPEVSGNIYLDDREVQCCSVEFRDISSTNIRGRTIYFGRSWEYFSRGASCLPCKYLGGTLRLPIVDIKSINSKKKQIVLKNGEVIPAYTWASSELAAFTGEFKYGDVSVWADERMHVELGEVIGEKKEVVTEETIEAIVHKIDGTTINIQHPVFKIDTPNINLSGDASQIVFGSTNYDGGDNPIVSRVPLFTGDAGYWLDFRHIRKLEIGPEGRTKVTFKDKETLTGELYKGVEALIDKEQEEVKIPIEKIVSIEFSPVESSSK